MGTFITLTDARSGRPRLVRGAAVVSIEDLGGTRDAGAALAVVHVLGAAVSPALPVRETAAEVVALVEGAET